MVHSCLLSGATPQPVQVEVELTRGLPRTQLLGLPGPATREGAERAQVALAASGFELSPYRTTINLHPTDERKEGSGLDLAIAVALKLVIAPAVFIAIGHAFGVPTEIIVVLAAIGAAPGAASSYVLAKELGGNAELTAGHVTVTSLPLWIAMVS